MFIYYVQILYLFTYFFHLKTDKIIIYSYKRTTKKLYINIWFTKCQFFSISFLFVLFINLSCYCSKISFYRNIFAVIGACRRLKKFCNRYLCNLEFYSIIKLIIFVINIQCHVYCRREERFQSIYFFVFHIFKIIS